MGAGRSNSHAIVFPRLGSVLFRSNRLALFRGIECGPAGIFPISFSARVNTVNVVDREPWAVVQLSPHRVQAKSRLPRPTHVRVPLAAVAQ